MDMNGHKTFKKTFKTLYNKCICYKYNKNLTNVVGYSILFKTIKILYYIMMYRIEWMSLITNTKSNGDWFELKDKMMLEDNIKHMNEKYAGEIQHWLGEK